MPRKRLLLLVDDETSILQTLQMVFENEGYQVLTAQSCAEALNLLHNGQKFDAVITDLNMEREDIGLEVARAAQRVKPRPAIVIYTGFASVPNSRAALDMGVDYMAHKPVEISELISALNRLISKRAVERSR
ncbi:MAG: response regulator [Acidobacteria bacterium]|nr:MAG: response regulator [Acidobacteriota bacterium]HMC32680.1 response regulator [Candidatus Angelobacter sp.]